MFLAARGGGVAKTVRAVSGLVAGSMFFRSGTGGLSPDPRIAHDAAINRIFAFLAQLRLQRVVL
jgi:hypothetical protein